jgi:chromatin structure-remodeling complex subunit RSC1/2
MGTGQSILQRPLTNGATPTPVSQPQIARPSPSLTPNPYQHPAISPAPQPYRRQNSFTQSQTTYRANIAPSTPAPQQPQTSYSAHQNIHPQPNIAAAPSVNYTSQNTPSHSGAGFNRPIYQQPSASATPTPGPPSYGAPFHTATQASQYPDHRAAEVFVLSDTANASIPPEIRKKFPQDDQGRVLFFTKPPVVHDLTVKGKDGVPLRHSERYLIDKAERERLRAERKRAAEMEMMSAAKRLKA